MFEYRQGYFKALLDLNNYTDSNSVDLKRMKLKKFDFIVSLIKKLLTNGIEMDLFIKYGGEVETIYNPETKQVVKIKDKFNKEGEGINEQ
jgi:hypothetical protein